MTPTGTMWRMTLGGLLLTSGLAFGQREVNDFNRDWRFTKGEQPEAVRQPNFDDSKWQVTRLPHDWAIAGPFDPNGNGNTGKLPWQGVGWYRKTFTPQGAAGQRVYFDFDGVMAFPKVYVNGQLAGEWNYGYTSFRVDATPYIRFGQPNVIAVEVDTRKHQSRWYPGAGIYRKVTMTVTGAVHIGHWSTFVSTPAVSDGRATVRVQSSVENHQAAARNLTLEVALLDPAGKQVVTGAKSGPAPANGSVSFDQQLLVPRPQRWDLATPNLYTAVVTVRSDAEVVDKETIAFGIRTFQLTANDGFYLNGKRIQLYGVDLHHDLGALGAAFNLRAMQRELEIMKDMGANAIRTSHNPPAPELLDLCDRMGLFVWDEAFDKWNATGDNVDGVAGLLPNAERQITSMVRRDRNHPSVFVWSVGNEIGTSVDESRDGMSFGRLAATRDMVLKQDATRPVGIACHTPETVSQAVYDPLDFTGWNYAHRYDNYRATYPDKPILYSESASAFSTRGFYAFPVPNAKTDYTAGTQYLSSYDLNAAGYSDIADAEFALMEKDRFVAGEFVWTGFDYLGEPAPSREARSSYFGIVDLAGIPKDRFYLYRSHWRPEATTIHILPHWNWPDRVGKSVPVYVYTNGDSAELFLNGKSLGRRTKGTVPPKPANDARGKAATASSGATANQALDANPATEWTADAAGENQWLQIDLGAVQALKQVDVTLGSKSNGAGYRVKVSNDGAAWTTVATVAARTAGGGRGGFGGGGAAPASLEMDGRGRYLRIEFTQLPNNGTASVREIGVYQARNVAGYYDVSYKYRLRWDDVTYEPGELKAVAYKAGAKLGESIIRTAGPAATLRLTPDRNSLAATGEDLAYILVEAVDAQGNPAPLADNLVRFELQGPGEIAGIDNGDQTSYESFQGSQHHLFYGKAMLIVRTKEGQPGKIQVTAGGDSLKPGSTVLTTVK
ncbi:MAG: glycoside hydrolase family 2 TIM barrel-domain containing protein [Candidatus Solibacter sp.]